MKSRINLQLAEKEELKLPEFGVLESKILQSHMKTQVENYHIIKFRNHYLQYLKPCCENIFKITCLISQGNGK